MLQTKKTKKTATEVAAETQVATALDSQPRAAYAGPLLNR
jgi:hypothetical protein